MRQNAAAANRSVFGKTEAQSPLDTLESNGTLSVDELITRHIAQVLAVHRGNISAAARALGMNRRTLQRRLRKIRPPANTRKTARL